MSSGVKGEVWETALRIAEVLTGSDSQRAGLGAAEVDMLPGWLEIRKEEVRATVMF